MAAFIDQALLDFVALRIQVRASPEARAIVDRCLRRLTDARTADAITLARLEAEVEGLRKDLRRRLGLARRLNVP